VRVPGCARNTPAAGTHASKQCIHTPRRLQSASRPPGAMPTSTALALSASEWGQDGLRSCSGSRFPGHFAGNPTLLLSLSRDRVIFGGSFLAGTPRRFTCFRHRCFRGRLEGPPARAVKVCVRAAGRPNARVGQVLVCAGHVPRGRSRSDRVRPERGTDGTVALSVAFDSEERAQERTPRAARDANEPEI
jgi:hypothetical protein